MAVFIQYSCFTQLNLPFVKSRVSSDNNELLLITTKSNESHVFRYIQVLYYVTPRPTQLFFLPRSIKRVPGISGELVVKSKLSPRSGCLALQQLNPIHKKGHNFFFFLKLFDITVIVKIRFKIMLFNSKMRTLEVPFSLTQSVSI